MKKCKRCEKFYNDNEGKYGLCPKCYNLMKNIEYTKYFEGRKSG